MIHTKRALSAAPWLTAIGFAVALTTGCESSAPTPPPAPAPVAEAASAKATASAAAPAAPPAQTANQEQPPSAGVLTLNLGDPAATASAPAPSAAASASASPKIAGESALPKADGGVLAKGEADKVLKAGAPPKVRLLTPGKEPRSPIAYAFTANDQQAMTITLDMQMEMKAGERSLPQTAIPRMAMNLDLKTAEVSAAGDAKALGELLGISVAPNGKAQESIAKAMGPHLATMKGLSMSYWVSPHGAVRDMVVTLPKDAPAAAQQTLAGMNQSLESMVAPLPTEPVGLDGSWEVITRVNNAGVDILQYATYTLKSRTDPKASIDVAVRQLAASNQVKVPGLPANMVATVRSFTSSGTGTNEIDTGHVAPPKGAMKVRSNMTIEVGASGAGAESITIDSTLSVAFEAKNKP